MGSAFSGRIFAEIIAKQVRMTGRRCAMALWEQILLGMGGLLLLFFFWPGVKAAMARSREAENPDWKGALLPIGIVVLFVIVLIMLAKA
jgi:hypothetical protein